MTIHDIHDIKRKNPLIAYRREYSAHAHISYASTSPKNFEIEFSLELSPLGTSQIRVKLLTQPDYPSLSIIAALKERIHQMDSAGSLP